MSNTVEPLLSVPFGGIPIGWILEGSDNRRAKIIGLNHQEMGEWV